MSYNIGDLIVWTYNESDKVYSIGTIIGFGRRTILGNKEFIIEVTNKKTNTTTVQYISQHNLEEEIENKNIILYQVNNK
jgi:hypothetical protein